MRRTKSGIFLLFILVLALPSLACTLPDWVDPTPLPTATQKVIPTLTETPTAINTVAPTATETMFPTQTATNTLTPLPTNTLTPTLTYTPISYPYQVQPGNPSYLNNLFHEELAENWMGVGGQVFNLAGEPQKFIVVRIEGELNGEVVDLTGMTGTDPNYGSGGYEITLADTGIESSDSLMVTLFDLDGNQLSNPTIIETYINVDRLQIILNFVTVE